MHAWVTKKSRNKIGRKFKEYEKQHLSNTARKGMNNGKKEWEIFLQRKSIRKCPSNNKLYQSATSEQVENTKAKV